MTRGKNLLRFKRENTKGKEREVAVTVSFALKRHISPKGWGFKKQVVFEEKTAFYMDSRSYDDSRLCNKGIKYGIYKDALLTEPVEEIDFDRARDEENGEYFMANINTVLETGAYYIGISAKITNISPFSFIAQYSYIYDE